MATLEQRVTSEPGLVRELGVTHAASVVIGIVIGSGIFLVPAEMMQAAGSAPRVFLAWIVGGVFSLCGAITYSQLGAMKPQAGGEYVYIRDAYGPLPGFLCAWTWTIIVKPSSLAAMSTGVALVLGNFPALSFLVLPDGHLRMAGTLVAIAFVAFVSLVNYVGVRRAGDFQRVFTVIKIAVILAIAALAFTAHGSWSHFSEHYSGATGGTAGFVLAVTAALWALDGWSDLNMVAEEVSNPARNIPLAILGGFGIIAALYLLVSLALQYALPALAIGQSASPMSDAVSKSALGMSAAVIVSAGIVLSLTGTLNGTAMSGARMSFAVARDGNFFDALARVHARFHTPYIAILFQAVLSFGLLLIGGNFRQLFTLALFAEWLSYVTASSTLFVFHSQTKSLGAGTQIWQYPISPALFIVASAALLYYTFTSNLWFSALGSFVILAGIPVYFAFARRRQYAQSKAHSGKHPPSV
jgi:basic amino acid/polyamine antiporter, APA family